MSKKISEFILKIVEIWLIISAIILVAYLLFVSPIIGFLLIPVILAMIVIFILDNCKGKL